MTRTKNIGWHTWTVALIGAAAMASGCTKDDDPGIPAPTDASSEAKSDAAGGDSAADGADATTAHFAIVAGADITSVDLTSAVKLVAIDLDGKSVAGSSTLPTVKFGDVVAASSGGRGFLIERSGGKVAILDAAEPWKRRTRDRSDRIPMPS